MDSTELTSRGSTLPPPLPTPGTGGREEIPAPATRQERHGPAVRQWQGCASSLMGTSLGRYAAGMALLVAVWAMSGGGYFWPVWPAIGWGFAVLSSGLHHGQPVRGSGARSRGR